MVSTKLASNLLSQNRSSSDDLRIVAPCQHMGQLREWEKQNYFQLHFGFCCLIPLQLHNPVGDSTPIPMLLRDNNSCNLCLNWGSSLPTAESPSSSNFTRSLRNQTDLLPTCCAKVLQDGANGKQFSVFLMTPDSRFAHWDANIITRCSHSSTASKRAISYSEYRSSVKT